MLNGERKTKYLGFRVAYEHYLLTIEAAQNAGISVTDFILSLLIPAINKNTQDVIYREIESIPAINKTVTQNKPNGEDISLRLMKDSEEQLNQFNKIHHNGKYDQTRVAVS